MKILLGKRRALGDTVLLSSSVELLARSFPAAEISVLVPGAFGEVLEGNPHIRRIFSYDHSFLSLAAQLRRERFDHFFQLHASAGARGLGWLAGARRTHFHAQNAQTERAYGKHPHALEWDGFFFRTVFGETIQLPAPPPRLYLSEAEQAEGREYWRRFGVDPGRIVFFGLGASRPTKRWLPAHFARLAELLRDRNEWVPAFVVGPSEEEERFAGLVINELRARGFRPATGDGKGDFVHGAGLSVRALAKAISATRAYVGNDSGPKHMAAALGVRTFTIFGPEDPGEWHPYDRERHPVFFLDHLSCRREDGGRWCSVPVCTPETPERHRCMRDIDPLDVYETVARL